MQQSRGKVKGQNYSKCSYKLYTFLALGTLLNFSTWIEYFLYELNISKWWCNKQVYVSLLCTGKVLQLTGFLKNAVSRVSPLYMLACSLLQWLTKRTISWTEEEFCSTFFGTSFSGRIAHATINISRRFENDCCQDSPEELQEHLETVSHSHHC